MLTVAFRALSCLDVHSHRFWDAKSDLPIAAYNVSKVGRDVKRRLSLLGEGKRCRKCWPSSVDKAAASLSLSL